MQYQFVAIQMIKLASLADLSDEVGRRYLLFLLPGGLFCSNLWALTKGVLTRANVPVELFETLMDLTTALFPNESERIRTIVDVISDIKEPLEASC